jgi:pilus assembly protein Flp/PilA
MWALLKGFRDDQSGATAIEYALIASMIFMAIISIVGGVGGNLTSAFTSVNNGFH